MSTPKDAFVSIEHDQLEVVAGGASRGGSSEVTAALTSIQSSIKDLAGSQNSGGMDPMMMMVMMMMMGGGGGGGGGYVAAPAGIGTPPVINIATDVAGGGGGCGPIMIPRRGKKGW